MPSKAELDRVGRLAEGRHPDRDGDARADLAALLLTHILDAQPDVLRTRQHAQEPGAGGSKSFKANPNGEHELDLYLSLPAWPGAIRPEQFEHTFATGRLFVPAKSAALHQLFLGTPWAGRPGRARTLGRRAAPDAPRALRKRQVQGQGPGPQARAASSSTWPRRWRHEHALAPRAPVHGRQMAACPSCSPIPAPRVLCGALRWGGLDPPAEAAQPWRDLQRSRRRACQLFPRVARPCRQRPSSRAYAPSPYSARAEFFDLALRGLAGSNRSRSALHRPVQLRDRRDGNVEAHANRLPGPQKSCAAKATRKTGNASRRPCRQSSTTACKASGDRKPASPAGESRAPMIPERWSTMIRPMRALDAQQKSAFRGEPEALCTMSAKMTDAEHRRRCWLSSWTRRSMVPDLWLCSPDL